MRKVEEIGKPFKKQGFLRGTALWKWRNIIIGSVVSCVLIIDTCVIYYGLERNKRKKAENQAKGEQIDPISSKVAELESRKAGLLQGDPDFVPTKKDIPLAHLK